MTSMRWVVVLALGVHLWGGCVQSKHQPDVDSKPDSWHSFANFIQSYDAQVDLLFVVDNSNSMDAEQWVLATQMRLMLQELINPTDPGILPVDDLHVGVITTDVGSGGNIVQTCDNAAVGDDGVLQNIGQYEGCAEIYGAPDCSDDECPWLTHSTAFPDDGTIASNPPIWEDFGCIAVLGTGGCGFEQQLESSYRALVEQTAPGRPNEGFLRENSLLAIVYVTDEDDCSTPNDELFDVTRVEFGPINVRCAIHEEELYPISRYHDAFVDLKNGNEDRIVVAGIVGIPVDGSWYPGDPIEELRYLRQVDASNPNQLIPSCDTSMGVAYPPVRLVELVYSFGVNGVVESICREDWTAALSAITRRIQQHVDSVCVSDSFNVGDRFDCRVVETLSDGRDCPYPADVSGADRSGGWHVSLGLTADGLRECEVLRADYDGDGCPDGADCGLGDYSNGLQGWFLNTSSSDCPAVELRFTNRDTISGQSAVRFECPSAD